MKFRLKRIADDKGKNSSDKKQKPTKLDLDEELDIPLNDPKEKKNQVEKDAPEEDVEDIEQDDFSEIDDERDLGSSNEDDKKFEDSDVEESEPEDERENDENDYFLESLNSTLSDMIMGDGELSTQPITQNVNTEPLEIQIDQIAKKGADVLKEVEDYRDFVDEIAGSMSTSEPLANEIMERAKEIDEATDKLYTFIQDLKSRKVMDSYQNPLMGMPNDEPSDDDLSGAPDDIFEADEEEKDSKKDESSADDKSDGQEFSSPNEMLDQMGEVDFEQMMGLPSEKGVTAPSDDEGEGEDLELPSEALPKQPKVEPKGKPKKGK